MNIVGLILAGLLLPSAPVFPVSPSVWIGQSPTPSKGAMGSFGFSLPIKQQGGNCPQFLRVKTTSRYYEGGGEHTVIPDTLVITGPAKYRSGNKKTAEYEASLKPEFANCKGQILPTPDHPYRVQLANGKLLFRLELPPDTPAHPSLITYRAILTGRPYIRWAIAD